MSVIQQIINFTMLFVITDPVLLARVIQDVKQYYPTDSRFPFLPLYLIIATWSNVTFKGSIAASNVSKLFVYRPT